jgi:hypothetical protein
VTRPPKLSACDDRGGVRRPRYAARDDPHLDLGKECRVSTWAVVLLGLIALGSIVQSIFVLGMLRSGYVIARRLREIQRTYDEQLQPALATVVRIQQDVAELSELLARQQERMGEFMQRASEKVDTTRGSMGPLAKVLAVAAVVKGAGKGLRLVRKLRRLF